jgi:hypothetical protein
MTAPLWSFAPTVPALRTGALLAYRSFEAVLELLATATVSAFTWEPFKRESLRGCNRAAFLIDVTPEAYDAFFISPMGLRAQYAVSVTHGEAANRRLLSSFEPRLRSFQRPQAVPTAEQVHWSLCGSEAKIWIYEDEVQDQLGRTEPEILYAPWEASSESGVGLLAPYGRKLHVMGGWLSPSDVVVPNPDKATRSADVHRSGYS